MGNSPCRFVCRALPFSKGDPFHGRSIPLAIPPSCHEAYPPRASPIIFFFVVQGPDLANRIKKSSGWHTTIITSRYRLTERNDPRGLESIHGGTKCPRKKERVHSFSSWSNCSWQVGWQTSVAALNPRKWAGLMMESTLLVNEPFD